MNHSGHIVELNARKPAAIAIVAAIIVGACVVVWFAARFQIGDLISEVTSPADPAASEFAETSIALSPSNPRSHWLKGAVLRTSFDSAVSQEALTRFTAAARLGPNNYIWWTELGRAFEQVDDPDAAQLAYTRAVDLAPHYTQPRWQLGNFYLRRGMNEQAVAELRMAAQHSKLYRGQVFNIAWNVFGKDSSFVEQFATDGDDSRVSLALFYASQNMPELALRNWNMVSQTAKPGFARDAETAARMLINHRSFAAALEFARQAEIDPNARAEAVTNGDFESGIKDRDRIWFDWSAGKRTPSIETLLDGRVKASGSRSFRVQFRNYTTPWVESLAQTIVLVPGQRYRASYALRTEQLRGGSLPRLEIISAADSSYVAASPAFPSGDGDWTRTSFDFTAPAAPDGFYLKLGREPCADECPLNGSIWLDAVEISRI